MPPNAHDAEERRGNRDRDDYRPVYRNRVTNAGTHPSPATETRGGRSNETDMATAVRCPKHGACRGYISRLPLTRRPNAARGTPDDPTPPPGGEEARDGRDAARASQLDAKGVNRHPKTGHCDPTMRNEQVRTRTPQRHSAAHPARHRDAQFPGIQPNKVTLIDRQDIRQGTAMRSSLWFPAQQGNSDMRPTRSGLPNPRPGIESERGTTQAAKTDHEVNHQPSRHYSPDIETGTPNRTAVGTEAGVGGGRGAPPRKICLATALRPTSTIGCPATASPTHVPSISNEGAVGAAQGPGGGWVGGGSWSTSPL